MLPEQVLNELNTIYGDVSHFSSDELTALSFCLIEGSISNHRLQYVLNMHSSDITKMLKKLCVGGYLEAENYGRWTTYKIKHKVASSDRKVDTSGGKVASSDRKVASSGEKVASSDRKVASLGENLASSGENLASSGGNLASSGGNLASSGGNLASLTELPKRISIAKMEDIIMRICKDNYVKKEEIATLLNRSENYIRNEILPKMIKEKKIEKKYPYTHNHPEQAYKTTEEYAEKL